MKASGHSLDCDPQYVIGNIRKELDDEIFLVGLSGIYNEC